MPKFTGRQQEVGIARETTRGQAPATPSFYLFKSKFDVEDKIIKAVQQGSQGVIAALGESALTARKWAEGNLEFEVTDKALGLLMYAVFGSLSSAVFSGAHKHTLTLQNLAAATTLALYMHDPISAAAANNRSLAYKNALINSFELNAEIGELVKATINFMSRAHTDWEILTPSYSSENKFTHKHAVLKVATNLASLDAAAKISLQSLTLRIEKNAILQNALGTVQPIDVLQRAVKISGTFRLLYEDRTYRDYMLNGDTKSIRIALVNGDVTIGTTNPQFQLDLPVCHFFDWAPTHELDEIAEQEISFEALYDTTNGILIGANTFVVNEEDGSNY